MGVFSRSFDANKCMCNAQLAVRRIQLVINKKRNQVRARTTTPFLGPRAEHPYHVETVPFLPLPSPPPSCHLSPPRPVSTRPHSPPLFSL